MSHILFATGTFHAMEIFKIQISLTSVKQPYNYSMPTF